MTGRQLKLGRGWLAAPLRLETLLEAIRRREAERVIVAHARKGERAKVRRMYALQPDRLMVIDR